MAHVSERAGATAPAGQGVHRAAANALNEPGAQSAQLPALKCSPAGQLQTVSAHDAGSGGSCASEA
jgi:hypothetical protein